MDVSTILFVIVVFLGVTTICVVLFERFGFGAVLGFIVAGVIIGPHTPGPILITDIDVLQNVAQIGVVLFLFTVGLEMRPEKVWSMRRLLFGLGSAQMLLTATALATYLLLVVEIPWKSAIILGFGFAMSSTAIILVTLGERGDMGTEHGKSSFAILMAQDLWVVPVMALVPILSQDVAQTASIPVWEKILLVVGVIAGIVIVGRYLLPAVLGYCANQRRMDAFGLVLFLAVITAAWAVDQAGISMTLGAFLLGMLLSASDYRYQIESTVAPFKGTLMGLFFVAVGMSINVEALFSDWSMLLVHVPAVLFINTSILIVLALAFGISRPAAIRTGFYLSQVGEFSFVLLGAATVTGLLSSDGHTLAMLVVSASMILTPLMVKLGDLLASYFHTVAQGDENLPVTSDLNRHVVVVGYEERGRLICLMLNKANIPYIAVDRDIDLVRQGKQAADSVYFGNMYSSVTQRATGLSKAIAVYVTVTDMDRAKALAITLHRLYADLDIYVHVHTLQDQSELASKGIKYASTGYIESTLVNGSMLLKGVGVPEDEVSEMVKAIQYDNYEIVRATYTKTMK